MATPLAAARPETLDMVVVREGTEGPYTGTGGAMRKGTPDEIATQESINTAFGVERVARDAFVRAMARPRRKLTLVHKTNVLTYAGDLWQRTVDSLAKEFTEVSVDYCHVDAASMFFVSEPERFDVIVTDNLFGDILTDLGAAVAGGIGLAASGNINPEGTAPSMFEPVHGSAPDIAGQSKADPTAAILSAAHAAASTSGFPPRQPGSSRPSPPTWSSARAPGRRAPPSRSATTSPSEYPAEPAGVLACRLPGDPTRLGQARASSPVPPVTRARPRPVPGRETRVTDVDVRPRWARRKLRHD